MITFERTIDCGLIRLILSNPRCYRMMSSDAAPPLDAFEVGPGRYQAVLCKKDGLIAGIFLLVPGAGATAEVHFSFLPSTWGDVETAARGFLEWVWAETPYSALIGPVPSHNRLALRMARECGFVGTGEVLREVGTKNEQPFDLILTRIERPSNV